ncbi:MAG: glycine--tRNA ligase subunit beta [Gammaproteobacteria bacterium RIFCSPHIGHO2_12_FULL_37_14]|nr:MAG: glycine--tRNA ligase subunit beta [Gammaproteobacteria bacterium RIFCSPHIGHO2_12_FULL_37_14]
MNQYDDFLIEILTEELPPKALLKLAKALCQQITERLCQLHLTFHEAKFFATPRRLAVLISRLSAAQPDQLIERKGPAKNTAFDQQGNPSPALIGFARSCGVKPTDLITITNHQGEWMGFQQKLPGKNVIKLIPDVIVQALAALPIPKRMRWGESEMQFIRPVHHVVMLYGEEIVDATILGCQTTRVTYGHRFLAPEAITLSHAALYSSLLETQGYVIADFAKRRDLIYQQSEKCILDKLQNRGHLYITDDELLDEVTGLVEWPVALCGQFDDSFLTLPTEVLISAMQDHQRYFPIMDNNDKLLPYFITISNIQSSHSANVIHGNERVLRARLADAAFFYETDKKESLEKRVEHLRGIIFQAKLGTLYEKSERISKIAAYIATKIAANIDEATRAGWLSKADLTTHMVNEFPELQGIMGYYYALHDKESNHVAMALKEQYLPRFAGDNLPQHPIGEVLALADRVDTLIGTFGINQLPTGDKDPYGLRRMALGILRILIENNIALDLQEIFEYVVSCYAAPFENTSCVPQALFFLQERMRSWYQEQGVTPDVFAAVVALGITKPLDVHLRIKAVQAFKKLSEADALSIANKRVSNILSKYTDTIAAKDINPIFFESPAEHELANQLELKSQAVAGLCKSAKYDEVLLQLAELRQPVDDFFDKVMVMTEDRQRRENRILLLSKLRAIFLQVADIALLQ